MSEDNNFRSWLLTKLISTALALGSGLAVAYFSIRWMNNIMDPTKKQKDKSQKVAKDLLKSLGIQDVELTEYELCIAANLVNPSGMSVTWNDIAGLDDVIQQIQDTVIFPFRRPDLCGDSSLLQIPKGLLLYGPPGCGKTMVAKAVAKAAHAHFIHLQVSTLLDMWYGESQKRADAVFTLAFKLQPCIIFIDEIDAMLRSRSRQDHESTSLIKTQFMSLWDGLITDPTKKVMVLGATNRPEDVDAAILRRMPCRFKIGMPDKQQRKSIMTLYLKDEQIDEMNYDKLGEMTDGLSGSDMKEACRLAAIRRVKDFNENARRQQGQHFKYEHMKGNVGKITMADLEFGVKQVKESANTTPQIQNILLD